jgi:hypothetical protein
MEDALLCGWDDTNGVWIPILVNEDGELVVVAG